MWKITGLTGKKGAGKDTLAKFLREKHGYLRMAFADKLYQEVADAFKVTLAFLEKRETKELPLPELALEHCWDAEFVEVALELAKSGDNPLHLMSVEDAMKAPLSPRMVMQLWGTDYRRVHHGDGYWRDHIESIIRALPEGARVVITDVRFPDEAKLVEELGGVVVRVLRPTLEKAAHAESTGGHSSERAMDDYKVYKSVLNPEGQPWVLEDAAFQLDRDIS